jgi:MFS family permease
MSRSAAASFIVPSGVEAGAARVLVARALRSFGDGYVAVLLPAYLLALGFRRAWAIGIVGTVTLLGSAIATLSLGAFGNRVPEHRLLAGAAVPDDPHRRRLRRSVDVLAAADRRVLRHAEPERR